MQNEPFHRTDTRIIAFSTPVYLLKFGGRFSRNAARPSIASGPRPVFTRRSLSKCQTGFYPFAKSDIDTFFGSCSYQVLNKMRSCWQYSKPDPESLQQEINIQSIQIAELPGQVMILPVKSNSKALPRPTNLGSRWVPLPEAKAPTFTSGKPNLAFSEAARKSHAKARTAPPPRACPLQAAMIGNRGIFHHLI